MRITKISWSDKKTNDFVNYYVFEPQTPGGMPVVMESPLEMSSRVALEQINKQNKKNGKPHYEGSILHAKLDLASGRIYFPEAADLRLLAKHEMKAMYDALQLTASAKYGSLPMSKPIAGDPASVIRIRSVDDFPASSKFIRAHLKEESLSNEFVNLPVVEANLARMPLTRKQLPEYESNRGYQGGLVSTSDADSVSFVVDERLGGADEGRAVHIQKTPFILINTSSASKLSESDKERVVVLGYKDFSTKGSTSGIVTPTGKYTVKYLLYMGYSFKDLCLSILDQDQVNDFGSLMQRGAYLLSAAKELKKSGYADPARNPVYYCFKIDRLFPYRFRPQMTHDQPYSAAGQSELFTIVHYDPVSDYIVFKSPLHMNDALCQKIFKAQSVITRCEYDPLDKKIMTDEPPSRIAHWSDKDGKVKPLAAQKVIRQDMENNGIKPPEGKSLDFEERHRVEAMFAKRMVGDYYQAHDLIKELCKKLSTPEKPVQFSDMPVIVGPWSQLMSFEGGYTNMAKLKEYKVPVPLQPIEGADWFIMPPFIMIDNAHNPSVADQTHIIIHEYRHHINEQLGVESPHYDMMSKDKNMEDAIRKRLVYLESPDERESHIQQMEYLLGIGWTKDHIIRHFMGGDPVTLVNMRVAKKYLEFVNEAKRRITSADDEAVSGEVLENMLANLSGEEENIPL